MVLSALSDGFAVFKQWVQRRPLRAFAAVLIIAVVLMTIHGATRPARHDRNWVEHLSRLPLVELQDSGAFSVAPFRDWSYSADGPNRKTWINTVSADVERIENVWFVVEPHPGLDIMAHTLVLFEFSDDRLLGLTIEARREEGESYSPFWGNWGKFELLYMWGSARDLLTRRAVYLDHGVQIYPLALSGEQERAFLRTMLKGTRRIAEKARLYNTLFSNCTNELGKSAGLDWHYAFVATGLSARRLHKLGLIPNDLEFETVRERAMSAGMLKLLNNTPEADFDARLLVLLREAHGIAPQ